MSAETLRKAANLMRARAMSARAGSWSVEPSALAPDTTLVVAEWEHDLRRVAVCSGSVPDGNAANAVHIASWHPAVAVAVADWLESEATWWSDDTGANRKSKALAVATAYLGEQP